QPLVDEHDLAARHQAVVHIDVDGLADLAVELQDRAGAEFQQLGYRQVRLAEHGRDVDGHIENRGQVGRGLVLLALADGRQRRGGLEFVERQVAHRAAPRSVWGSVRGRSGSACRPSAAMAASSAAWMRVAAAAGSKAARPSPQSNTKAAEAGPGSGFSTT